MTKRFYPLIPLVPVVAIIAMMGLPTSVWERGTPSKLRRVADLGVMPLQVGVPHEITLPGKIPETIHLKAYNLETGEDESAALSCLSELRRARKVAFSSQGFLRTGPHIGSEGCSRRVQRRVERNHEPSSSPRRGR